jgi:hypothetical protein
MTIKEEQLYAPILELFGKDYFAAFDVQLGPKRIDIVLASKTTDKIVAIEVKVNKWRQAMRQALNYQLAADESYVAIPEKNVNPIDLEEFDKLGIGLIAVNSEGKAAIRISAKPSLRKQNNYSILLRAYVAEKQTMPNSNPGNISSTSQSFQNYLWYIANERSYYNQYRDTYDGFLVNAHVLEHFSSAFSALYLSLRKPFFIIPDTHFFQLAPITIFFDTKGGIKSSWEKLAENYGPLIKLVLSQGRNLEISDFISKTGGYQQSLYDLVENVISFQKNKVPFATQGLARFFDVQPDANPTYLVAPYFFFTSIQDPWYKISLEMAREATKHKETCQVFALLCTSKSVLMSDKALSTIISDFSTIGLDGFLLWIQDFSEIDEPDPLLLSFRKFVSNLKKNKWNVINLYGEFFSSLMCYYGLDGVGYGICYKESADPMVFPTGGPAGGPLPRYYLRDVKAKLGKIEAAIALSEIPSLKCSCKVCDTQTEYILDAATPDAVSKDLMKKHFLICKGDERDYICKCSLASVLGELKAKYKKYQKKAHLIPIEHLRKWIDVCKEP